MEFLNNLGTDKISIVVAAVAVAAASFFGLKYIFTLGGSSDSTSNKKDGQVALDAKEYRLFKLKEKFIVNHNTRIFRFSLPNPSDRLGLPIGQHISIRANIAGKEVYRPYTPISSDEDLGYFDLMIKVYEKGAMSGYIDKLFLGDSIEVRGPKGQFNYTPNMFKKIGMLAGGTGITPMLQVVKAILKNPQDKTEVSLIFGNINEEDILLREDLDQLAAKYPSFKVYYVLNNPPKGWTQGQGFITQEIIQSKFPEPAEGTMVCMCGPPMMNKAMQGHLASLNYPESSIFTF
eukprot:gene3165-3963_t